MKKFILLSISLLAVTFIIAQTWVQKNNFPGVERFSATGFEINGKFYMGTGYNGVTFMNDWWEYNPATDQWTQKASFPGTARYGASTFTIDNMGYILFGTTNTTPYTFPKDVWQYDPNANQWTQKATFPGVGRYTAVAMEINGKGYVGTGWKQVSPAFLNDWWEYNPTTNTWTQKTSLPASSRQAAFSFSINGKGYITSGAQGTTMYNDLWEFNPINNTWLQRASFNGTPRADGASFVLDGHGYVGVGGSGEFGGISYTDFYKYNPSNNTWSFVNSGFSPSRVSPVSLATKSCAYIITGRIGPPSSGASPQTCVIEVWAQCLVTSVENTPSEILSIDLSPNPTLNKTTIKFYSPFAGNMKVELKNLLGKEIKPFLNKRIVAGYNEIELNIQDINSGLYFLTFEFGGKKYSEKLIKY